MYDKQQIYNAVPSGIQDLVVSIEGTRVRRARYRAPFAALLAAYRARQHWSYDQLVAYQRERLRATLELASRTRHYQAVFRELGGEWQEFVEPARFAALPVTTKEMVQRAPADFRPRPLLRDDRIIRTSGTTGLSLELAISANVEPDQWAVWWRYRGWHGIQMHDWCALFGSAPVVPPRESSRFWRYNSGGREYRFSVYHISADTVASYVRSLNRLRPQWVHGNPSAISLLGRYILEAGLELDAPPRNVTVGSENMRPWQVRSITEVFGAAPVQHYGLAEAVANISECPQRRLHVDEDFSYVEFVDADGEGVHRLLGTSFSNEAMVLLRYDTGDTARLRADDRCDCGLGGRTIERIDGRSTDYVTLPGGRRVASLATPFHGTDGLAEAQIHQDVTGALTIRYVPGRGWREDTLLLLERKLRQRIGDDVAMRFQRVDRVQRSERGKIRLVLSDFAGGGSGESG